MSDLLDEIRYMVADAFQCSVDRVTAESSPETIEEWDSLRHVNLVLAVEDRYGVSFDPLEAANLVSVAVIVDAVVAKRR